MANDDPDLFAKWQFDRMVAAGGLLTAGQADAGVAVLEEVLAANPDHVDALNWMGSIRCLEGRIQEALDYSDRAVAVAPNHAGVLTNRGNILVEAGDFNGAAEAYRDAIHASEKAWGAMTNLAALLHSRGLNDDAEFLLKRVLDERPRFGLAHYYLANVFAEQRRFDESIQHAKLASKHAPTGTVSIAMMAAAYVRNDDLAGAVEVVRRWLAASPEDKEAQHLLVVLEGKETPERAPDGYVESLFDRFSGSFDAKLAQLDYQAPALVGGELEALAGPRERRLRIVDVGCGTGLCATYAREFAAHLCGVDLSAGMLGRAQRTGLYDRLVKAELGAYLAGAEEPWDVVFSADTLCYFGALEGFAAGAANALLAGGLLIFTVEASDGEDRPYRLQVNGRYQHAGFYVRSTLEAAGFDIVRMRTDALRKEFGKPVIGHVVAARKR
jgi:predicted TPR repeat methyltransferase